MATPYREVAKAALIQWNGLSEEEANKKIKTESIQELDNQVYAMDSVKYAVVGTAKQLGLSEEETLNFFDVVVNGPEISEIFEKVGTKAKGVTNDQIIDVLSTIHDIWVQNNCSEEVFNKKVGKKQLRQYAPLELIGFNEVKSDLLFLKPILASIGVNVDENALSQAYHNRVDHYMEDKNINSIEDLSNLLSQGRGYYAILPEELDERLKPLNEEVANQITNNWQEKDKETNAIFIKRQQNKASGGIKK